ncbi:nuclear pore complex protein Nup98-Nup96, partial [Phenoliferia sp. Uapishka_3]
MEQHSSLQGYADASYVAAPVAATSSYMTPEKTRTSVQPSSYYTSAANTSECETRHFDPSGSLPSPLSSPTHIIPKGDKDYIFGMSLTPDRPYSNEAFVSDPYTTPPMAQDPSSIKVGSFSAHPGYVAQSDVYWDPSYQGPDYPALPLTPGYTPQTEYRYHPSASATRPHSQPAIMMSGIPSPPPHAFAPHHPDMSSYKFGHTFSSEHGVKRPQLGSPFSAKRPATAEPGHSVSAKRYHSFSAPTPRARPQSQRRASAPGFSSAYAPPKDFKAAFAIPEQTYATPPPSGPSTPPAEALDLIPDVQWFVQRMQSPPAEGSNDNKLACALADSCVDLLGRAVRTLSDDDWCLLNVDVLPAVVEPSCSDQVDRAVRTATRKKMARFGFEPSSDEESGSGSGSGSGDEDRTRDDESNNDDFDTFDGIPRASLNDPDDQTDDGIDVDHDEEDNASKAGTFRSYSARSQSHSISHRRSSSSASSSSDIDIDIPERRNTSQRSFSVASSRPTERQHSATPSAWAPQPLKVDARRIAVMQASFFMQPTKEAPPEKRKQPEPKQNLRMLGEVGRPEQPTVARTHFAAPVVDLNPLRTFRKYLRVDLTKSITAGNEGSIVDSGLMLGRSYRAGWGPTNQIVHMGSLYGSKNPATSDTISISKFKSLVHSNDLEMAKADIVLRHQLAHTEVSVYDDIPEAAPHPDLNFAAFADDESFKSPESSEGNLWRLGAALFDEITDLSLPENATPEVTSRIRDIRRRDRLDRWLGTVVREAVEGDLRNIESKSGQTGAGARRIFALLSGHDVERACATAAESRDIRLATLLAQAGGDDEFREDVVSQLKKWRAYSVDAHIDNAYRKVYEVLSGNVQFSKGVKGKDDRVDNADDLHIAQGLDWKRAFGLHLWYGSFQTSLATVVSRYETAASDPSSFTSPPLPPYIESPRITSPEEIPIVWASNTDDSPPTDPLFSLIKIFTDPTYALENALLPRNFGSSPLDYRLPWHLYILFKKVLGLRDFQDRDAVPMLDLEEMEDEDQAEGNSARADAVTEGYASQLELGGKWLWAAFVLLHLEIPECRAKAIKDLLERNANEIIEELGPEEERLEGDDVRFDNFVFLVQTLKIPLTWIFAAQATAAKYTRDPYREYQLLVKAEMWNEAHAIAVTELAPEALLINSPILLRDIFSPFEARLVTKWESGGKIFVNYAQCVEDIEKHLQGQWVASLLLDLIRTVPSLLEGSPSLKLRAAVSQMQSQLVVLSSMFNLHSNAIRPSTLREADRLVWLAGANDSFLEKSMAAACAA